MIEFRAVRFHRLVRDDLIDLRKYIAANAGRNVAEAYIGRWVAFCMRLRAGGQRGRQRPELLAGLRSLSFERSATVFFSVSDNDIAIFVIAGRGLSDEQLALLLAKRPSIAD